jgi:quercetin dioxygenase-like cupin family protein
MNVKFNSLIAVSAICGLFSASEPRVFALEHGHADEQGQHQIVHPDEVQWKPGPTSLPPGAQFVILEGDPAKPGPFTMRVKFPPNYKIPPHTHPKVERVTVLKGEFKLGMGSHHREESMKRLPAGGFFTMPPGMQHFAGTDQETIVQLNGVGPWDIIYVNPADDPRKRSGR